jgi:beta-glucosidase-like glycosyl hydrolase
MFVRIGSNLPPVRTVEDDEERIARLLETLPLGGLVLFNGRYETTPSTLARLQAHSRYPLLVSADLERGVGQQLRGYPLLPHAMAFEALGDGAADAVRRFAELTAQASRGAGVHINFAPVADVNSDPRNPIIATRAFGTQPARVSQLITAFIEGSRAGGLLATAKHFPGHGDTHEDSHHALPTVDATRREIATRELAPFRSAVEAGVPLIMTAHVRYPALDESGAAATLSHPILTALLREGLGFAGAVVTDSLLMVGFKVGCPSEGELALMAINAGVDILLDVAEPLATLDALESAVASNRLFEARVEQAFARLWRLKQLVFPSPTGARATAAFDERENRLQTEELALDVARRATAAYKNDHGLLPFRADRTLCAILVNPFPLPANADPPPLGQLLAARFPRMAYFELGADPPADAFADAERAAAAADQVLAAFVVKPAAWHRFGLPPAIIDWLQRLAERRPLMAACLGAPQGLEPLSSAAATICTFSDVPASHQALTDALLDPPVPRAARPR